MREILFRGFHPNENGTEKVFVNGEWIKGYWIENNSICQTKSETYLYFLGMYRAVLPETVCQYTGLKDKNGNKIFEGDILNIKRKIYKNMKEYLYSDEKGVVEYDVVRLEYKISHINGNIKDYGDNYSLKLWNFDQKTYEIIGSIHSNPELLEAR